MSTDEVGRRRVSVALSVAADLSPSLYFDRWEAALERAKWAAASRHRLDALSPGDQPPADAIYLLSDDLLSAWFKEIEEAGDATIVTLLPADAGDEFAANDRLVVVTMARWNGDVAGRVEADDPAICHLGLGSAAWEVVAAASTGCAMLWWATPDGLVGYRFEILLSVEVASPSMDATGGAVGQNGT